MNRMFLVVKGNRSDAETQAPMIDRPKIVDWYCEDSGITKIALRGECLWYTERKDSE